ncbi:Odorant receptor 2 [Ladona fulva]|uniref:Odorant receptor n=1 Tax=Ladona fulva TaxID=123851 RepID=A0A8K0K4A3_LADFU|nr:Odorant receptor 2 [Ladona fulva]
MGRQKIRYLTVLGNIFNVMCLLPMDNRRLKIRSLVLLYHIAILVLLLLRLAGEFMDFVQHINHTYDWPRIASIMILTIMSILRIFLYAQRKEKNLRILQLWEKLFTKNLKLGTRIEDIQKDIRTCNMYSLAMIVATMGGTMHWALYPLVLGYFTPGKRVLPLRTWYPIDLYSSPTYEIVYAFQFIGTLLTTYNPALSATSFLTFSILVQKQVQELKKQLKAIGVTGKHIGASVEPLGERRQMIEADVLRCIKFHSGIIRFVREMQNYYSSVLVIEYLSFTLPLCFTIIEATSGSLHDSIAWAEFFVTCSLTILLYCWNGSRLTLQLLSIQDAISEALCGHLTNEMRWNLRFMMHQSNVEFTVTGGRLFITSMETFKNLIGFAVSNYLFFKELKG